MLQLAATDPANPYGALLRWPAAPDAASSLTRSVGARVILCDGALVAYLRRGNPNLQVFLPDSDDEPARSHISRSLAEFLVERVQAQRSKQRVQAQRLQRPATGDDAEHSGLLIASINGIPVAQHPLARYLLDAGFHAAPTGFNVRRNLPPQPEHELRAHA